MLVQHYALNADTHQPLSKRVKGLVFVAGFGSDNFVLGIRSVLSVLRHNFLGTLWSLIRLNAKYVTGINMQASRQLMFLPGTTKTNMAGEGAEAVESCLSRCSPLESGKKPPGCDRVLPLVVASPALTLQHLDPIIFTTSNRRCRMTLPTIAYLYQTRKSQRPPRPLPRLP